MTPQRGRDRATTIIGLAFGGLVGALLGVIVIVQFFVTAPVGGMIVVLLITVLIFAILGHFLGDRMYQALGSFLRWFP